MAAQTLANRLATYATSLTFDKLTKEAVHETKRRFIDSFATAVGAMPSDAYAIAKQVRVARVEQPRRLDPRRRQVEHRVGHVRQRPAHPLPRLQRHLPEQGAGPPERQPRGGACRSAKRSARAAGTSSPRRCWPTRSSAASATRPACASTASITSPTARSRRRSRPAKLMKLDATQTHAHGRPRRRLQRRAAADAQRRTERVEGLRLRQRGPQRRVRRHARRRRADRPRADLRGRPRLLQAGVARAVRPGAVRRRVRQPGRVHDQQDLHQVLAGGVPLAERHRRGPATPRRTRAATCRTSRRSTSTRSRRATTSSASTRRRGRRRPARRPTTACPTAPPRRCSTAT